MTTINTRTTGPQAWKIALVAVAASLATLIVVNLPIGTDTGTGQSGTVATQAVPDQTTVDLLAPVATQETLDGSSVGPQAVPAQATIVLLAPVITQETLDGSAGATVDVPATPDSVLDRITLDRAMAAQSVPATPDGAPDTVHVPMANNQIR